MKVSIITMHNYPNYGSVLQAFATQEKMKEYADEVEIIDYAGGSETVGRSLSAYIRRCFVNRNPVKGLAALPIRLRKRAVFGGFAREHLNLTATRYDTAADLVRFPVHDGFYCSGSDQLWNPYYRENLPFFFDFIPEGKRKFAYATSFGDYKGDALRPEDVQLIQKFIRQYGHISVREARGLGFVQNQLDCPAAVQLVDPTLAMTPEFWRSHTPPSTIKGGYILLYKLGSNKSFEQYALQIAQRTGLPLVRLCSQSFQNLGNRSGRTFLLPSVSRFLSLISHADYVITDSFHGAAFSLNLNRQFMVHRENYDGGRISSLLALFGLEHRHMTAGDQPDPLDNPIDFAPVNLALRRERQRVDNYLHEVFL